MRLHSADAKHRLVGVLHVALRLARGRDVFGVGLFEHRFGTSRPVGIVRLDQLVNVKSL